ncbi:MAG: hypothetical protein RL732_659 [Bacteroidota bacterium]|jgi:hypothetical protein
MYITLDFFYQFLIIKQYLQLQILGFEIFLVFLTFFNSSFDPRKRSALTSNSLEKVHSSSCL